MGDDNMNQQHNLNEVTLQVYDPTTGFETGDFVHVKDFTCRSCCAPSPPLSACSLTEEEIESLTEKPTEDEFANITMSHWGEEIGIFPY